MNSHNPGEITRGKQGPLSRKGSKEKNQSIHLDKVGKNLVKVMFLRGQADVVLAR